MIQRYVLSLGSINVDVEGRLEGWPEAGESILGADFLVDGGGKAANVALLSRKLGAPTLLIGSVGDDGFREIALARLRIAGVELSGVRTIAGCPTGLAWVAVRSTGNKAIVAFSNANACWSEAAAAEAAGLIAGAPAGSVLVADLEIPDLVVRRSAEVARERGFPFILDPSRAERVTSPLLRLADYITPDSHEARVLTGIAITSDESAIQAGRVLVGYGVGTALMKLPHGGCVVVTADRAWHISALPQKPVDTTGAGDAFAGALAVALVEGRTLEVAACWGVAAASLAVLSYGAQPSYPNRYDLERYLTAMERANP